LSVLASFILFSKSYETLLGYAADRQEVLGTIHCSDFSIDDVICTLPVVHKSEIKDASDKSQFYYQML
jgi:hypothetical protein